MSLYHPGIEHSSNIKSTVAGSSRPDRMDHPICRFLIKELGSRKGRAKADFLVDLVGSVDGLLTLVQTVYNVLNQHNMGKAESYRNMKWTLHFNGDDYTFCDPEIRQFTLLPNPLRNGQRGWFKGEIASFEIYVESTCIRAVSASKIVSYPKIQVVTHSQVSSNMDDDWISGEHRNRAIQFRNDFREYMDGANVWNQDWSGEYFRDRPKPPKWTTDEDDILCLLIKSGYKFQESWQRILQYGFVNRSEVGTSQEWYKIRKKKVKLLNEAGKGMSKGELIVMAKCRCYDLLEKHLHNGVPTLGEHPLKKSKEDQILLDKGQQQRRFVDASYNIDTRDPKRQKIIRAVDVDGQHHHHHQHQKQQHNLYPHHHPTQVL